MKSPRQTCRRDRAGFTLLETMLAASIGTMVVFACLGMFFLMSRTDKAMEARAAEQADLERLRVVMERSFSTLLMSDEPRMSRPGEVPVATPVDDVQAVIRNAKPGAGGAAGAAAGKAGSGDKGGAGAAGGTDRFGQTDRFASGDRFGADKSGAGSGGAGKSGDANKLGPGQFASDAADADAKGADSKNAAQRQPPPARLFLTTDALAVGTMELRPVAGEQPLPAESPQRLELVLYQSPVPSDGIDPVEAALTSVRHKRTPAPRSSDAPRDGGKSPDSPSNPSTATPTAADQAAVIDTLSAPARSVRGAFEVRPQPRRVPGVPEGQYLPENFREPTGLWQVWWVPLPRLGSDGLPEVVDYNDNPNALADSMARPFLVASNLKYIKWTVFHRRERKAELSSIWSSDLPAYVEVQAETGAGLAVNWMFEIDWAVGPEVAHQPVTPASANQAADGAKDKADTGAKGDKIAAPSLDASGGKGFK